MSQEDEIQKYLENQMSEDEAAAFKKQLELDDDLKDKVFLKKDLDNFFNDFRPDVVQNLNALGTEFFEEKQIDKIPQRNRKINPLIIGSVLLIIVLGSWYFYSTSSNPTQNRPVQPANETTVPATEETPNISPIEENLPEPNDPIIKPIENQPIAEIEPNLYRPNPLLEGFLNESSRSNDNNQLLSPEMNKTFFEKNIQLDFNGYSIELPPYELKIYSNKSTDFENDKHLMKLSIPTKKTNDRHTFRFLTNLELDKGLYYILIKKEDSDKMILVSKFKVK